MKKLTKSAREKMEKTLGISLDDYKEACKHFSRDTKNYMELNNSKFYVTGNGGDGIISSGYWCETCDNSEDGISVEWAFHLSAREIEKRARDEYIYEYNTYIECIEDNL